MGDERRLSGNTLDIGSYLAILYTLGYLTMVGLLFFIEIPAPNRDPVLNLFGLMGAIQMAVISFYFGSSKSGESAQRAVEKRQLLSDNAAQDVASHVAKVEVDMK